MDFGNTAEMARVAYYEASAAAVIIPTAWPAVGIIYLSESDPRQLSQAAQGCFDTAGEISKAREKIQDLVNGLSDDDWHGKDRDAFHQKIVDYADQLDFSQALVVTIGVVLTIMAWLIFVFILVMTVIATILAAWAAIIIACYASIVGAEVGASLQAEACEFGVSASEFLGDGSEMLSKISYGLAGVLGALMAVDVGGQMANGNYGALSDLGIATLHGMGTQLKGLAEYVERKMTAGVMDTKFSFFGKEMPAVPKDLLPYFGPQAGIKAFGDTYNSGQGDPHSPIFTGAIPTSWSDPAAKDGYGDDYVDKTEPTGSG